MDRLHTERLCDRYRHLVPPERVRQVKDMPVLFEDRHDFERSYREAGGANPPEGTQAVGFSLGTLEPAHVDMHDLQLEKTAIHERVHQLSDPRAREALGEKFYEGVTEDLAIKELGHQPNPELPRCYPRERAAAQELRRICGDDAVDRAYFAGDTRQLGVCLERRLGKDNLAEFRRTADATSRHGQDDRELGQCRT
ncbi:MAG: hypothetical protein FJ280_00920 [Planctomycetes bacterium]|nr:hypothetical protein [Planctomycetota bacterium]